MARYTRQELLGMEGQGGSPETSRDVRRPETSQDFPSTKNIYQDIYTAVLLAGEWVTRAEIAKAIGLKKASWIAPKIEELVDRGYLEKYIEHPENGIGLPKYHYRAR